MKEIKVKFCDGFYETDDVFLPILKKHYNVVLSDDPDYVIYGPFGAEHLKYDCIRIFTTGECVIPNFNECDYATGFDYMEYGDRYIRLPLCCIMFRNGRNMLDLAIERGKSLASVENKKFCSFVVSNENGMKERYEFFTLLSRYKQIDSGGKYMNNTGARVDDKLRFDHEHKFCIAFENESHPGYTTEKIVDAFAAGSIPIYYGDPRVAEMFNTEAFINCHDFENFEAVVERVKELDSNDGLYNLMLAQPVCSREFHELADLEKFLCNIFNQSSDEARRRPQSPCSRKIHYKELSLYNKVISRIRRAFRQ